MTRILVLAIFMTAAFPCIAYEAAYARVILVQSTYMPTNIQFEVDNGTPSCPAKSWLTWSNANTDNNKATYATLLTAIASGNQILYYINDGDTSCKVVFLDIVSN